jgi:hypothetical protein
MSVSPQQQLQELRKKQQELRGKILKKPVVVGAQDTDKEDAIKRVVYRVLLGDKIEIPLEVVEFESMVIKVFVNQCNEMNSYV